MATMNQPSPSPGIMVFRPTMQEFKDFAAYIKKMEDCGAHKFGIAKVKVNYEYYAFFIKLTLEIIFLILCNVLETLSCREMP